jgi:Spx/MgsR family transcriptional regulator
MLRPVPTPAATAPEAATHADPSATPAAVTLWGLEKCDTCRKARAWLDRVGIAHRFIDYREQQRVEPEVLKDWARQVGGWEKLINRTGPTWRNLPTARKLPQSDPEWTLLVREHPALVRRPVVVTADGTVSVGFTDALFKKRFGV